MDALLALCAEVDVPLDVQLSQARIVDGVRASELCFAGARDDRVSAWFTQPLAGDATVPCPGLLFMHWGFGSRASFLAEAAAWSRVGAACLALDAPHCGLRGRGLPALGDVDTACSMLGATLTEIRRGLRVLQLHGGVDPARIAYVGHSFGATLAPHVAALGQELRAVVAMAGAPRFAGVWSLWPGKRYRAAMAPFDGIGFMGSARAPWLLQYGTRDEFIEPLWAREMQAAAPAGSSARWYEADHALNAQALRERADWLAARLELAVPDVAAVAVPPEEELRAYRRAAPAIRLIRGLARWCGRG